MLGPERVNDFNEHLEEHRHELTDEELVELVTRLTMMMRCVGLAVGSGLTASSLIHPGVPPPPPPPPPPATPSLSSPPPGDGASRGALLGSIQNFTKCSLKKTEIRDRSTPQFR
ncbi:UNVERIFIED_CONTAM: hypothetical protein FKN15_046451 [Acipenser sinensis]